MRFLKKLFVLALLVPIVPQAFPVYYTFSGKLGNILTDYDDEWSYFLPTKFEQYQVGQEFSLTFLFDTDRKGEYYDHDIDNTDRYFSFYAEYLSGDAFYNRNSSLPNKDSFGYARQVTTGDSYFHIATVNKRHSGWDDIYLVTQTHFHQWEVGKSLFYLHNHAESVDSNGNPVWVELFAPLTLSKVSDSAPVPEPGSMALMGLGLVGLGFFSYRRRKNVKTYA